MKICKWIDVWDQADNWVKEWEWSNKNESMNEESTNEWPDEWIRMSRWVNENEQTNKQEWMNKNKHMNGWEWTDK